MALQFRFFLDDTEIDEPIGWDNFQISITRDESLHGIGFEASTNSLEFYGTALDYIDEIKLDQGLRSNIIFKAEQDCDASGNYDVVLEGRLDMNQYKKNCGDTCTVSLPVQTASCEDTMTNRYSQSVDIDKTVTQNGINALQAYPQLGIDMTLAARALDYQTYAHVADTGDIEYFSAPANDGSNLYASNVRPDYANEFAANIKNSTNTGGINVSTGNMLGDAIPISNNVLFDDVINCFHQPIKITARLKGRFSATSGSLSVIAEMIRRADPTDITSPSEVISFQPLGLHTNPTNVEFDLTFAEYDWTPHSGYFANTDDQIFLSIGFAAEDSAAYDGSVQFDKETFFKAETVKECPSTDAEVYMIHETISRVVESITDDCMRLKSSYYGRTDSQPFSFDEDGCGSLRCLTSGLKIRKAPTASFFLDLKTAVESLQDIDNIGMGVEDDETVPGNYVLRLEALDYFYQNIEIIKCLSIASALYEVEEARNHSIIKIGYKNWKTLANFGLDEFNSDREYHVDISTINNTIDLTAEFVAGQQALEITRDQNFVDTSSADTTYDDNCFIICLKRLSYNTFAVEQGNIIDAENIFSPGTIYNYRISPLRNLMRWYRSLINVYPNLSDSANKLYFSAGTGNFIGSGQLSEGYGYGSQFCKQEGVDLAENADLYSAMFNDVASHIPLWVNESITFDYPMSLADYNNIKKNRYGFISYQCGNGEINKGWIKTIQYTPAKGMASIILRQKWQ